MTEYANTTDSVKTVENEAAAAKYWHDMYVATSQMAQDYEAKVGKDMVKLETEVSALHTEIDTLHKILITRTEQIVGLQDEIRNLTGEE